ncbi:unnamed protein product, partial [Ectocarpus fasciculatus]
LVVQLCAVWPAAAPTDLSLSRVSLANSNYVYIVRNSKVGLTSNSEPHSVVLRLYGKMNVMFDRREEERVSVALSEMGMIPRFYAVFGNGRVEPFIEHGSVPAAQFRRMSTAQDLVQKLRRIHTFVGPMAEAAVEPLKDKLWARLDTLERNARKAQVTLQGRELTASGHADMFREIERWDVFRDHSAARRRALQTGSPLVFAHCDLHHGNVLNTDSGLQIIDYEYSIPTARGFDLANYFCEFCSDYDQEKSHELSFALYPEYKDRMQIYRAYLGPAASQQELLQLERETSCYRPFVHLQWAHWGLVKAQDSHGSAYDHLRYAYLQYREWTRLVAD